MTRKHWQMLFGFVISVICIVALFTLVDVAAIGRILRSARPGFLLLAAGYIVIFLALRAVRWRYLLANSVSGKNVFHIQNVGYMLSQFLPLRLGDVARAVLIGNQPPVTVPQGVSTMAVEPFAKASAPAASTLSARLWPEPSMPGGTMPLAMIPAFSRPR